MRGKQKATRDNRGRSHLIRYDLIRFSVSKKLLHIATGLAIGMFIQWLCYNSILAIPISLGIAFLYVNERKSQAKRKRIDALQYHFKDLISSIYSSMCGGYSLQNSLKMAEPEMEGLFGGEDILVQELKEINLGISIRQPEDFLFRNLGVRSGIEEIQIFGEVLSITKRSGGNFAQVLTRCRTTIYERIELRHEINTMLAARRMELLIMSCIPAGIILYLRMAFGTFFAVLYTTLFGRIMMSISLGIYLGAIRLGIRLIEKAGK